MPLENEHHHIVSAYDRELTHLRALVVKMGSAVVRQTQDAMEALIAGSQAGAREVIGRASDVDALNVAADEEVFRVIARRQPTAIDLRLVLAIARVVGDLERAGDKAERIANNALKLLEDSQTQIASDAVCTRLRALEAIVADTLERSVEALVGADLDQAVTVLERDEQVDAAREDLRAALLGTDSGLSGTHLAGLLTVAHALERIGNHANNIAEQVVFVITGDDVRFRNRALLIDKLKHRRAD